MNIENCMSKIKREIELCISTGENEGKKFDNGSLAKESLIRSSRLIGYLHECVKEELIKHKVKSGNIFPPLGSSNPEVKITGFLKQKDQDVTVIPSNIEKEEIIVDWGPLKHENIKDLFGIEYTSNCLVINIRSQLSSLAKNADTLFERTFAEAMNLHTIYKNIVLGEVYLIPVYEYNEADAKNNIVSFSNRKTNLAKYISFFSAINNRLDKEDDEYKYERCALLVVDFSKEKPVIYNTTDELKRDGLIDNDFDLELEDISFLSFAEDILKKYGERFDLSNIIDSE